METVLLHYFKKRVKLDSVHRWVAAILLDSERGFTSPLDEGDRRTHANESFIAGWASASHIAVVEGRELHRLPEALIDRRDLTPWQEAQAVLTAPARLDAIAHFVRACCRVGDAQWHNGIVTAFGFLVTHPVWKKYLGAQAVTTDISEVDFQARLATLSQAEKGRMRVEINTHRKAAREVLRDIWNETNPSERINA